MIIRVLVLNFKVIFVNLDCQYVKLRFLYFIKIKFRFIIISLKFNHFIIKNFHFFIIDYEFSFINHYFIIKIPIIQRSIIIIFIMCLVNLTILIPNLKSDFNNFQLIYSILLIKFNNFKCVSFNLRFISSIFQFIRSNLFMNFHYFNFSSKEFHSIIYRFLRFNVKDRQQFYLCSKDLRLFP